MVGPNTAYSKPNDHNIFTQWLHVSDWISSKQDAKFLTSLACDYQSEWLILDDYRVDEAYQLVLRAAKLRWLQFDGTATKPLWADYVLNTNPMAKPKDYVAVLKNQNSKLLLGPTFAILRPEFEVVKHRELGRTVKRILVTFGGGDDRGAIEFVLSALLPNILIDQHFVVISGSTNPNNDFLSDWIKINGKGRVSLHIEPQDLGVLFSSCDLAIMAGGTSIYEACAHGIPMLVISIADNQILHSKAWEQLGCVNYLGSIGEVQANMLFHLVYNICVNKQQRFEMSNSCKKAVSGKGAKLVAALIN